MEVKEKRACYVNVQIFLMGDSERVESTKDLGESSERQGKVKGNQLSHKINSSWLKVYRPMISRCLFHLGA